MKNIIPIIFALLLVGSVSAAGLISPYWSSPTDHPMHIDYGQTKVANFKLSNTEGEEPITIELELKQGTDIASLEKTTYTAEAGEVEVIPVTISIPSNYNGAIQQVELEARSVAADSGGMITLGSGWSTTFNVVIGEPDVAKSTLTGIIIGLVIAVIVLLIIIILIMKRRR